MVRWVYKRGSRRDFSAPFLHLWGGRYLRSMTRAGGRAGGARWFTSTLLHQRCGHHHHHHDDDHHHRRGGAGRTRVGCEALALRGGGARAQLPARALEHAVPAGALHPPGEQVRHGAHVPHRLPLRARRRPAERGVRGPVRPGGGRVGRGVRHGGPLRGGRRAQLPPDRPAHRQVGAPPLLPRRRGRHEQLEPLLPLAPRRLSVRGHPGAHLLPLPQERALRGLHPGLHRRLHPRGVHGAPHRCLPRRPGPVRVP
eukprot:scaffold497_cov368-Prasinococcus_capsulatus_cf.AAC.3